MKYAEYIKNNLEARIPSELIQLSKSYSKRKDVREKLLKTYSIILIHWKLERKRRINKSQFKKRYYDTIPSTYFEKVISKRYYLHLQFLRDHGFIQIKGRKLDYYESGVDLFEECKSIETYKPGEYSKSYTIEIFPCEIDKIVTFPLTMKRSELIKKNVNFIKSVGVNNISLTRDNYGFRLYSYLSSTFKEILPKGKFIYYDISASIPHQIKKEFVESGYENDPFLTLFNGDFYENWNRSLRLGLTDRNKMKTNFTSFLYGDNGDYDPSVRKLISKRYPLFSNKIKYNYGRTLVRKETNLVLNTIIGNSPISLDKILSVHDGWIIPIEKKNEMCKYLNSISNELSGFKINSDII